MTDTIWQTFANAVAAIGEASAVQSAVETAVLEGGLGGVRGSDDEWDYDSWSEDEDSVASYFIQSIKIRDAGVRGSARGMLSIAISFFRPEDRAGEGWSGGRRAKLYVGVAPTIKAWDKDSLLLDGSGCSDIAEARDGFRWYRTDAPSAWFFCIAVDAIDSREALMREVMRPLAALLGGAGHETAFAGTNSLLHTPAF